MKTLITKFGVITLLLLTLILSLPLIYGVIIKKKCHQLAITASELSPIKITISDYQQHWFTSTALITIDIKWPQKDTQPTRMAYIAHISHGPIIIDLKRIRVAQAQIIANILPPDNLTNLNKPNLSIFKIHPKLESKSHNNITIQSIIKLSGKTIINIFSQPYEAKNTDYEISTTKLNFTLTLNNEFNKVKQTCNLQKLTFVTPDLNFKLNNLSTNYDGYRNQDGLWIGDSNIHIDALQFDRPNKKRDFSLEQLNIESKITAIKNILTIVTDLDLQTLTINGAIYTHNKIIFNANGINATTIAKMTVQNASIFSSYLELVSNGIELSIPQLETTTPWGKLNVASNLTIEQSTPDQNIIKSLTNAVLSITVNLHKKLALHLLGNIYKYDNYQQAMNLLDRWNQENKVIYTDNNNIHLDILYKNTKLLLNSKPLSIKLNDEPRLRKT